VALSSTEAEYMALTKCTTEAIWLRRLLNDLKFPITSPTTILCDNQSAIAMLDTNKFHKRTKHIDIQYHFVREQLSAQQIKVQHCSIKDMVAEIMTKPLRCDKHFYLLEQLGVFGGESI
jgi:hypothetical protein